MARRKIGRIRQVKKDIASYTYLMNGVAGIGKTTTVCEIGQKEFGIDGFLLLTIGQEPEPEHLGNLWNERVEDWDDLDDVIDTLCKYKNEDYPNLKMIGIDSVDEIFRLAEAKVTELHNKKVTNPTDKVDTIKKCFGGFQAGENKAIDLVTSTVFKLRDYGYSLFFIGHTKQKNKKDLMTDIEFEQVTSNLDNKYYNCIKDKVNIVGCAYYERELTDLQTMKDAFSKKQKQVGKIASEKRVISFRDEEYALDVKSHLKYICDKCELDSDTIIKELKTAMEKQANIFGDKPIDNDIKVEEKPPVQEKKPINEAKIKKEKIEKIKENLASLDMASLQKVMVKYEINNFEDAETIPMECLDEILELI